MRAYEANDRVRVKATGQRGTVTTVFETDDDSILWVELDDGSAGGVEPHEVTPA